MKLVLQRVSDANVVVNKRVVGKIEKGLVVFLGIEDTDSIQTVESLVHKIVNLRIFSNEQGKMNLSLQQIQGEILIISQFTLFADCSNGNRPSFSKAGNPEIAKKLYHTFIEEIKNLGIKVENGIFGADMKVSLTNDGPVTILLEQ